jgi:hypothetical protein
MTRVPYYSILFFSRPLRFILALLIANCHLLKISVKNYRKRFFKIKIALAGRSASRRIR